MAIYRAEDIQERARSRAVIYTMGFIQQPKLTKQLCLTDFTCASYKIKGGNV